MRLTTSPGAPPLTNPVVYDGSFQTYLSGDTKLSLSATASVIARLSICLGGVRWFKEGGGMPSVTGAAVGTVPVV